ncbi:MAG: hypothetical protein A3F12_00025 [Gammaproteobacteria bacterium RIFCSPHIGHO2_12_FULL_38_14]|nr:MAG: hypothetical protein A3F12_00025 [Gammaproteobacteria bacterium RIFCSPHIGHO2_12_FULL_38_14]
MTSLDTAKSYIDAIDFSMVVDKIVQTKKWKKKNVLKICEYYRNFLFLKKKYRDDGNPLPPSLEIDEFWHNHILDTKKYTKDCETIFGEYLHHYPYFGIDGKSTEADAQKSFLEMQQLYEKEFGEKIYRVRALSILDIFKISGQIIKEFFSKKDWPDGTRRKTQ